VSVPMIFSDLERRDAMGQFFFRRISVITLVPFDLDQIRLGNMWAGERRVLWVSDASVLNARGPSSL